MALKCNKCSQSQNRPKPLKKSTKGQKSDIIEVDTIENNTAEENFGDTTGDATKETAATMFKPL